MKRAEPTYRLRNYIDWSRLRSIPLMILGAISIGLLGATCAPVVLWAQSPSGSSQPSKPLPVEPKTKAFQAATDEMREHIKRMREILVRYNTSLTREEDAEYHEQWAQLVSEGEKVHRQLIDTALAEYQQNPENKALADMLWELVDRNAEVDRYEGLLPVAQALYANDYPEPKLRGTLALTAFATNEFEVAKPLIDEMIAEGTQDPQLLALQSELPNTARLWQEELEVRERDAAGEPLPRVRMRTTKGDVVIELFENQAPETVGNFIHLVESGFYENLTFHRVLKHFMAQTGCPIGDGTGDAGYTIRGEMKKPGARNFFRGTLGMALAQHPDSAGSQFFITFNPTFHLNGDYTAFGRVIEGMEVLGNIEQINPDEKKEEGAAPVMPDEIVSMEVLNKRDHEYQPTKVR